MKMPWGKLKGKDLEFLPSPYLKWIAENVDETNPRNRAICAAADKEWSWREKNGEHMYD